MIIALALLMVLAETARATLVCGQFDDLDLELQPIQDDCDLGTVATGDCLSSHNDRCRTSPFYYTNGSLSDTEAAGVSTCNDEICDNYPSECSCADVILCTRLTDDEDVRPFLCYDDSVDDDDGGDLTATESTSVFVFTTLGVMVVLLGCCYWAASRSMSGY